MSSPAPSGVEAEKIKSLAPFLQVHDPGLRCLWLKTEIGQHGCQQPEGVFCLLGGGTHHYQVIGLCRVPDYAEDGRKSLRLTCWRPCVR